MALVDAKQQQETWNCHCCTAKNTIDRDKCRVCGRLESYALQGYGLPLHGKNATLFRSSQILTVLEDIHEVDSEGWSSLHTSCADGNYIIVKQLLAYKAKVEALTKQNQTPLHLAVYSGNINCVKELIKYNANVNVITKTELTTPLHIACQYQYAEIVVLLIENGANVNSLNILKRTPLHLTAETGRIDIGYYLLQNNANKDILDIHSWNALQIAELYNHRNFQELLIRENMIENQVIIKELPTQIWHSNLWHDLLNIHEKKNIFLINNNKKEIENKELIEKLKKINQDKIMNERKEERKKEIELYNYNKNNIKNISIEYTKKLDIIKKNEILLNIKRNNEEEEIKLKQINDKKLLLQYGKHNNNNSNNTTIKRLNTNKTIINNKMSSAGKNSLLNLNN